MIKPATRAGAELTLAGAAGWGCVASWSQVRVTVLVAPIADGEPVTTSVSYDPPLVLLTLVLAAAAGVLAVLGVTRVGRVLWRRGAGAEPGAVAVDTLS